MRTGEVTPPYRPPYGVRLMYRVTALPRTGKRAVSQRDFPCRLDAERYARAISRRGYVATVRLAPLAKGNPARRAA